MLTETEREALTCVDGAAPRKQLPQRGLVDVNGQVLDVKIGMAKLEAYLICARRSADIQSDGAGKLALHVTSLLAFVLRNSGRRPQTAFHGGSSGATASDAGCLCVFDVLWQGCDHALREQLKELWSCFFGIGLGLKPDPHWHGWFWHVYPKTDRQ